MAGRCRSGFILFVVLCITSFSSADVEDSSRAGRRDSAGNLAPPNTPPLASWAGRWDSTIYNLMEHPRTVALRLECVDAETRLPITGVRVSVKGTYIIEARTNSEAGGQAPAQEQEYELRLRTNQAGVCIIALGWNKEHPWDQGIDEIEKAQKIECSHQEYNYAEMETPFGRFLEVGQDKNSRLQEPQVLERFEKAWATETLRNNVKHCVLDLGTTFVDFGNRLSKRPEFFERVEKKEWGTLYKGPKNWFSRGGQPQSLCGSYFVYLVQVPMRRLSSGPQVTEG